MDEDEVDLDALAELVTGCAKIGCTIVAAFALVAALAWVMG